MTEIQNEAPANLAAARKEMAAAKRRHPAASTTAKKAPAEAAPAEAAPAEAAAAEAADKPAAATKGKTPVLSGKPKLRWTRQDDGGLIASTEDATYVIAKSGDKFKAVVKKGSKSTTILDGVSDGRAYTALSRLHGYGEMPAAKKASA